jgi:acyl carrier protein
VPTEAISVVDVERAVTEVAAEALRLPLVDLDDNLLELGVDSLVGARIVVALRTRFGVEIPLLDLFNNPRVGDFARLVWDEVESVPE